MSAKKRLKISFSICTALAVFALTAAALWLGAKTNATNAPTVAATVEPGVFPGTGVGEIPDGTGSSATPQFGAPLEIKFEVSGIASFVQGISLNVTMTHTWVGDVEMILKSPNGVVQHSIVNRIGVVTATGGGDSSNFGGTYIFNDYANANIWTTAAACGPDCVIAPGAYRTSSAGSSTPTNFLFAFSQLTPAQANGTWTLTVRDAVATDTGAVTAANLTVLSYIDPPTPTPAPPTRTPTPPMTPTMTATPYPEIDLSISQTAAPEPVRVGRRLAYKVVAKIVPSVMGGGASPQIRFNFPAGLPFTYNEAYGTNNYTATADNSGVTFSGGILATGGSGSTADLYVVLTPQAAGTLTSAGENVMIDPHNVIGEGSETNNTAQTITTTVLPATTGAKKSFDFDGDRRGDLAVFRPENGAWYVQQSTAGFSGQVFGLATDKLVPADYDGDGKTDVAVYRGGGWYLQRSAAGFTGISFGGGDDVPVPADYNGDGKTDIAVFRPSNGYWYILNLADNQFTAAQFGAANDKPVPEDYDGDGRADIAVNRGGVWYLNRSTQGFAGIQFGDSNDKLVPADYDGDGFADLAVFRPSNGYWYQHRSAQGFAAVQFGQSGDVPVPADYDGDGRTDIAVNRGGAWYLNRSAQGFAGIQFGAATDVPVPAAFVP